MSGIRHSLRTVEYARKLYEAGWSLKRTAELVARGLGVPEPSISTVHSWVKDGALDERRRQQRRRQRQTTLSRAKYTVPGHPRSPEWKFGRMRYLHAHGIDAATIAVLMACDFDDDLSEDEVREAIELNRLPERWRGVAA